MKDGKRIFDRAHLEKVESWFRRYGEKVLVLSRFISGVRSVIALTAGVGNVNLKKMTVYTSISIVLWNGVILFSAFKVQQNWREILRMIQIYNKIVLALVILFVIGWLARIFTSKSTD